MSTNYPLEAAPSNPKEAGFLLANPFSRGTYRVWQRNRDAFLRLWKTELWPPFVEAVLTLLAFGLGLGAYVQQQIDGVSYMQWIAPGLVMTSVLFTASFECMFGTFIRMKLEKMFDAVVATPISLEEVVSAEIMWSATRAGLTGSSVLIVLLLLGLTPSWWIVLVPVVTLTVGFMLASMAIIVTSIVPAFTSYNYYITLGIIPMQLFSGVFFPVDRLPEAGRWLVYLSPFYPAVQLARSLFLGRVGLAELGYAVWIVGLALVFYEIGINLMHRRLIK